MPPIHGALQPGATANFDNKKYLKKLKPESTDASSNGAMSNNGAGPHGRYPSHHLDECNHHKSSMSRHLIRFKHHDRRASIGF